MMFYDIFLSNFFMYIVRFFVKKEETLKYDVITRLNLGFI